MHTVCHLRPALADAELAAVRRAVTAAGPLRTYVEAPLKEGIGKGLTRRHDAMLNHVRRLGGAEPMDAMAARANLFRATFGEPGKPLVPGVEALWSHPIFLRDAARVTGKATARPTMLYANALLPGQELAVHSDTPAYRGRDQTNTPEWLLVVMLRSGLFEEHRVRIGAAVTFLSSAPGGAFLAWDAGPDAAPRAFPAEANTAVTLDSDAVFHGVARVGSADAPPPPARFGSELAWDETRERWILSHRGEAVADYGWDDVRLSFQWKGRCLDPGEAELATAAPPELAIDAITERLLARMRDDGALDDGSNAPRGPSLAVAMIDHFVRFPTVYGAG